MKKKTLNFILLIVGIILLLFARVNYSEYNTNRSISACLVAEKMSSDSFNLNEAKKYCEEEIKKKVK